MADSKPSPPAMQAPAPALTLGSHDVTITLGGGTDLTAFVTAANDKARIKGLGDSLNPGIIDAEKLGAMVAALQAQPDTVRAALAGHTLNVGARGLGVLAIEPAAKNAFGPDYRVTIERVVGTHVLAHADFAIDAALARQRTGAAAKAVAAAEHAVHAVEHGKPDPDGLGAGDVRWRRAQAASGWLLLANAWAAAEPGDAGAKKALTAAHKAAKEYAMPSGGRI
jgi:hypothetical protein